MRTIAWLVLGLLLLNSIGCETIDAIYWRRDAAVDRVFDKLAAVRESADEQFHLFWQDQ